MSRIPPRQRLIENAFYASHDIPFTKIVPIGLFCPCAFALRAFISLAY